MTAKELDDAIKAHGKWLFHELCLDEDEPELGKRLEIGDDFITVFGAGHNFKGQDLTKAIFTNCRFNNIDFSEASLPGAEFHNCSFFECKFHKANMARVWLDKCSGSNLDMSEVTLGEAKLDNFRVYEVDFANLHAENITIKGGRLDSCKLVWARLRNGKFENLDIVNSKAVHAYFSDSTFTRCRLLNNNFECADIDGCTFWCALLSRNNFHKTMFLNTKLIKSEFPNNNLLKADLEGIHLIETPLDFSEFPLWCGSFGMKPDDRLVAQLIYHITRFGTENMSDDVKAQLDEIRQMPIARMFPENYCNDIDEENNA